MPIKYLLTAVGLLLLSWMVLAMLAQFGGEFYVFVPPSRLTRPRLFAPPSSPGTIVYFNFVAIIVFIASRRWGAILFTVPLMCGMAGVIFGPMIFEWFPGWGQVFFLTSQACFCFYLWWIEDLNAD